MNDYKKKKYETPIAEDILFTDNIETLSEEEDDTHGTGKHKPDWSVAI